MGEGRRGDEQNMPFEDAYGNGGLLTTIGDLLIWNRALTNGAVKVAAGAAAHRGTQRRDPGRVSARIAYSDLPTGSRVGPSRLDRRLPGMAGPVSGPSAFDRPPL